MPTMSVTLDAERMKPGVFLTNMHRLIRSVIAPAQPDVLSHHDTYLVVLL